MSISRFGQACCRRHAIVSIARAVGGFPSIGRHHAPAIRLERAIRDLYGHQPVGNPRPAAVARPRRLGRAHSARQRQLAGDRRDPADYEFLPVRGRGPASDSGRPGACRHHRARPLSLHRQRRNRRAAWKSGSATSTRASTGCSPTSIWRRATRRRARVREIRPSRTALRSRARWKQRSSIDVPERAQVLRGVMAELERIANHFGDIGAICNDATFTLIHAHCGILRERVLAAAESAFAHRLMMDRIVPGGVERDRAGWSRVASSPCSMRSSRAFAEIVQLYDDTPSLQDRTCTTGIVSRELVDTLGRRRICRPRIRPQLRRPARLRLCAVCRRDVRRAGVSGRRRGCARVGAHPRGRAEHSSAAQLARNASGRAVKRSGCRRLTRRAKASPSSRRSAATCWCGCASVDGRIAALPRARCLRGSNGRCWKLRSRTTSSPTSRCATSRSIAHTRGTTCDAHAAPALPVCQSGDDERADSRRSDARRDRPRAGSAGAPPLSGARLPSARSTPARATAASSRSTRSTTRSTTSSASASALSPRRAMPTCCW